MNQVWKFCSKTRRTVTRKRRMCSRLKLCISHDLRLVFQFYAINQEKKGTNSDPKQLKNENEQKAVEFIATHDQRKSVVFQQPWTWVRALHAKIYSNTQCCHQFASSKRNTKPRSVYAAHAARANDTHEATTHAKSNQCTHHSTHTSLFSKGLFNLSGNNAQSVYNTTPLSINAKSNVIMIYQNISL